MVKCSRASGVLLHVTSLPSAYGIGDLGPESYKFVELLARSKQHYWSILPLSPIRLEDGNSPYQTSSTFAGNKLLISPEKLAEDDLLGEEYLRKTIKSTNEVNFEKVYKLKDTIIERAYKKYNETKSFHFDDFLSENKWLDNYALYTALRKKSGRPWYKWPLSLRKREPQTIAKKSKDLKDEIDKEKFAQFLFFSQWFELKEFCGACQVKIMGDLPFYVAYDSADVWVHPELFNLDASGKPKFVGGVPPDYFSETGQLWGNPVYNWKKMEETGFEWWIERISHNLKLYDKLRLDHFRGFIAYWQVKAGAKTAKKGQWVAVPTEAFFEKVKHSFPKLPFIAEDLGVIGSDVVEAIERLGIPGMRVLLFAFDGSQGNPHLPVNHLENSLVFTGTHDTNTVKGWFVNDATSEEKKNLFNVIDRKASANKVSSEFIKLALSSVAKLSILPLQDVLSLGSEARMNNPSRALGNWKWRVTPKQLASKRFNKLREWTIDYNR